MAAGRLSPDQSSVRDLPPYVGAFALAEKLKVSVKDLDTVPRYWLMAAQVMLDAEGRYHKTIAARQGT